MNFKYLRDAFLKRMDSELVNNERKGDWGTWLPDSECGMSELYHHAQKLQKALDEGNSELISEYSADIANISMKISETHGNS